MAHIRLVLPILVDFNFGQANPETNFGLRLASLRLHRRVGFPS